MSTKCVCVEKLKRDELNGAQKEKHEQRDLGTLIGEIDKSLFDETLIYPWFFAPGAYPNHRDSRNCIGQYSNK